MAEPNDDTRGIGVEARATGARGTELRVKKIPPGIGKEPLRVKPSNVTAKPVREPLSAWDAAALAEQHMTVRGVFPESPFHHVIPEELLNDPAIRKLLKKRKIDIDDFTVQMSEGEHTAIHSRDYNKKWLQFFKKYPNARKSKILDFANKMRKDYKFDHLPLQRYQRESIKQGGGIEPPQQPTGAPRRPKSGRIARGRAVRTRAGRIAKKRMPPNQDLGPASVVSRPAGATSATTPSQQGTVPPPKAKGKGRKPPVKPTVYAEMPATPNIANKGTGRESRCTLDKTGSSTVSKPDPAAIKQQGTAPPKPKGTPVARAKLKGFRLSSGMRTKIRTGVKTLVGIAIDLALGWLIGKVQYAIWGDPIENAINYHFERLGSEIERRLANKHHQETIELRYLKERPGVRMYLVATFDYVVCENPLSGDAKFMGVQLTNVYIASGKIDERVKTLGWPSPFDPSWEGEKSIDYNCYTISNTVSEPLTFKGDIGGAWIACRKKSYSSQPSPWAIFSFKPLDEVLSYEVKGYMLSDHPSGEPDLEITVKNWDEKHLSLWVTRQEWGGRLRLNMEYENWSVMQGRWMFSPESASPMFGDEIWLRPENVNAQSLLQKKQLPRSFLKWIPESINYEL